MTKAAELRKRSASELARQLGELQREHFNLRMQQGRAERLAQPSELRRVRREIARVKTLLAEGEAESRRRV